MKYHFSVDDVIRGLLQLSDWDLEIREQPMLAFLDRLNRDFGCVTDLYLFQRVTDPSGIVRDVAEISQAAAERLAGWPAVRFGPHARDYPTPPHAQSAEDLAETIETLSDTIARFAGPEQRAKWLRLHFFSECFEALPLWQKLGVEALFTTDKPALAYRMDDDRKSEIARTGRTTHNGLAFVQSHLRLEFFCDEADDPSRFCARIDEILDRLGFVTLFTHEIELDDPRVRQLAVAALSHLEARGAVSM